MAILVGIIGGGVFEFGPEHDDERVRWEIGKHGQLAIIKQVRNDGPAGRIGWSDDCVLRVFNARCWSDVEIVE
jgi:hypothetical protein